jgi:hypothetical protein
MEANTETVPQKNQTKEGKTKPLLLVSGRLKGICEASGQEYDLAFAERVDYDENGNNPIVWYKTTQNKDEQKTVSGLVAF